MRFKVEIGSYSNEIGWLIEGLASSVKVVAETGQPIRRRAPAAG